MDKKWLIRLKHSSFRGGGAGALPIPPAIEDKSSQKTGGLSRL
jgi:hypothetical protein